MNIRLLTIVLLLGCLTGHPLQAQLQKFRFEQIDSLQSTGSRPVVIFIHTDWCRYCYVMQNTTFKNDSVVSLLNERFWYIELNAEEKQPITFYNRTFNFKPTGGNTGVHELAEQLGTIKGKISYPTLCILNPALEIVFQYNQYVSPDEMHSLLQKIGEAY